MSECVGGGCDVTECDKERIIRRSSSEYTGGTSEVGDASEDIGGTSEAEIRRRTSEFDRSRVGV